MATETKVLNCINCPLSCELTATVEDGVVTNVTGNFCPRGAQYAKEELTAPTRMLTSTVRVKGGRLPLLPVVSAKKLPKGRVVECAEEVVVVGGRCLQRAAVADKVGIAVPARIVVVGIVPSKRLL